MSGAPLEQVLSVVDHVVLAAPDPEEGCRVVTEILGISPAAGGHHPRWGTRNALLSLGPRTYLEVMGPDGTPADTARPRPFHLDGGNAPAGARPRVVTWAARTDDLDRVAAAARAEGVDLGQILAGSRTKPDGTLLQWKMTDLAMAREDGILPFFIDWGDTPHPGETTPSGCTLEELRLWHPQAAAMQRILQRLGIAAEIREGPAAVEAVIRSPRGLVTLR